ncbi:MAG: transcription initiation factor IIB [Candidatus Thorarchaeota archaeon]|nr:transcription initiation factor IIB [Candidatus Thorarchaeota archaeon]
MSVIVDIDGDGSVIKMASRTPSTVQEEKPTKPSRFTCPDCGAHKDVQILQTGDIVCAKCGLVVSERQIDPGPEWRAFTADEKRARTRTGSPIRYTSSDKGLSTLIGWQNKDRSGKNFSPERRAAITRMRKWQIRSRVHSSVDRNLSQANSEINRLISQLGLKDGVKELAAMLYRKLIVKRLVRSRSIDALAAASIYAALRLRKIPRSLKEIAKHSHLNYKVIGRYYRLLVRKLNLKMPVPDPMNYVPKFITKLNLPGAMQAKVLDVLQDAKDYGGLITGRDPRGLAAGAIYIASILTDNRVTQREIAYATGVTEVTVRNRYKELVRELEIAPL